MAATTNLSESGTEFSADDEATSPCEGHSGDTICVRCGVWLPTAVCLEPGCGWSSSPGPRTLVVAVDHQVSTGHLVRVVVGREP